MTPLLPFPSVNGTDPAQLADAINAIARIRQQDIASWKEILANLTPTMKNISGLTGDAGAGYVGEWQQTSIDQGHAVSLVSGTAKNVTTLSLTAGDWQAWGCIGFAPAGTTTISYLYASISLTTGTPSGYGDGGATVITSGATGAAQSLPVIPQRFSLSVTTPLYLVAQSGFGVSTNSAWGFIAARRMR